MSNRYDNVPIGINKTNQYKEILEEKNINHIRQYFTPTLKHLTAKEIASLQIIDHIWTLKDKYYKLASEHYGDPTKWWIIAHFNQKPTEAHVSIGNVIQVPLPLEKVLFFMGY